MRKRVTVIATSIGVMALFVARVTPQQAHVRVVRPARFTIIDGGQR